MDDAQASLLCILQLFRHEFSKPGFANFLVLAIGWIQCQGVRAVTEALVAAGVAGIRHHEAFHRFFSRGSWNPDCLGRSVFRLLVQRLGLNPIRLAIDDTLARKTGAHVFGIASHIDAVQSTRKRRVMSFGHCWVVLTLIIHVPFSSRPWAVPILFRLFRRQVDCTKNGGTFYKKTELARQMIDILLSWTDAGIELAADNGYCNSTVLRDLPDRVQILGSMRPNAALTGQLPDSTMTKGGKRKKRGERLPTPRQVAEDESLPWHTCNVFVYRSLKTIRYKTFDALWLCPLGGRLLRIVVVATDTGSIPYRVFFTTNLLLGIPEIIAGYGSRWAIECFFRDVKQFLGFGDSQARKKNAVERIVPFVGMLYSVLVIWFLEIGHLSKHVHVPVRPWYTHKTGLSFQDILCAARCATSQWAPLDLCRDIDTSQQATSQRDLIPRSRDRPAE